MSKKLTKKEWRELEELSARPYSETSQEQKRFNELTDRTRNHYEHPEWYEGYCECYTCLSYV
jgi:hypothetical protein